MFIQSIGSVEEHFVEEGYGGEEIKSILIAVLSWLLLKQVEADKTGHVHSCNCCVAKTLYFH